MRTSWTFYLERPCQQIRTKIGLFQDDELAVFKNTTGPQAEKIRKQITKRFKENGLKITIQCNLKSADYLGATLNLTNVRFQPYRKLNDEPPYTKSNHTPTVQSIQSHQSQIIIQQRNIRPLYDKALRSSGFNESLHYCKKNTTAPTKRNRIRNIIWFNPPCSNVVETFLNLIKRQFPPKHDLHPVFNKNNVKVSYGCMSIMGRIINSHNKKIVNVTTTTTRHRKTDATITVEKDQCTLDTNWLITSVIIFKAKLTTDIDNTGKNYIGLTEGMFQQRCTQHKQTFRIRKYANCTEI